MSLNAIIQNFCPNCIFRLEFFKLPWKSYRKLPHFYILLNYFCQNSTTDHPRFNCPTWLSQSASNLSILSELNDLREATPLRELGQGIHQWLNDCKEDTKACADKDLASLSTPKVCYKTKTSLQNVSILSFGQTQNYILKIISNVHNLDYE